jgi:hypothetical protein
MALKAQEGCKWISVLFISTLNPSTGWANYSSRLDAIITRYSSKIRRLVASDSLIKTTGVSGYAQAVLVPELTVLLIKEDMSIGDEAARQVLRESMEIGERLNYDGNDVVKQVEEK